MKNQKNLDVERLKIYRNPIQSEAKSKVRRGFMFELAGGRKMFLKFQAAISLFTCTCMLGATTVPTRSIGTVTANGEIRVDGSAIRSNSTLFDGSIVQTSAVRSDVRLSDGSQVVLNPDSRMTIYRNHAVLEQGLAMQRNAGKHAVIANGLKVSSETPDGVVLVGIQDPTHMKVAARSGAADVKTSAGDLVARIEPGKTLSFDTSPQVNKSLSSIRIEGAVRPAGGNFVLTDVQSGLTFQLQGSNLAAYSGASVQVIGTVASVTPTVLGASRVVDVSEASPQNDSNANDGSKGHKKPAKTGSHATRSRLNVYSEIFLVSIAADGVGLGLAMSGAFDSSPHPSMP